MEKRGDVTAWVVRDDRGQVLRVFADTNGDRVVDQWSFFKNGLEVYRDIDSDFNAKADEARWFNTAGSRWGFDRDEGPPVINVFICKDDYKSRKSDLDVSWLFTAGKIDSRELASALRVPWKPRMPTGTNGQDRYNPGLEKYKNPDW